MFMLANCVTNSHSTTVTLRSQDIFAALESALGISNYRFFLLIDGMDEMKTTAEYEYEDIAQRINHWSAQNSGHVKICVSSREYNAFMETFSIRQRMKLHAVTWRDIKALIDFRLGKYGYLTSEERESLATTIGTTAQGVFLWVILALKRLVPLLSAKQGIRRLVSEADTLPREMNDFLMETLRRFPECYRKEAWAMLTVMSSVHVMSSVASEYYFRGHLRLVHYSMLEKCLDSGWEIHERDDSMGAEDIIHQVKDCISRFAEFSSGLLELSGQLKPSESAWNIRPYFAHRSVYDFLLEHPDRLPEALSIPEKLQKLSAAELIVRATIQVVTDISWGELCKDQDPRASSGPKAILPALCATTLPNGNRAFSLLNILEETLLRKQGFIIGRQRLNETQWAELRPSPHMSSVFQIALVTEFSPFKPSLEWAQEKGNYPIWITSKEFKEWTAEKLFHIICDLGASGTCRQWEDVWMSKIYRDLDSMIDSEWLSYNDLVQTDHSLIPAFSPILRGSLGLHVLVALLVYDIQGFCENPAKYYTNLIEDVAILDIQFEWWFDWHCPGVPSSTPRIIGGKRGMLVETRSRTWTALEQRPEHKRKGESSVKTKDLNENHSVEQPKNEFESHGIDLYTTEREHSRGDAEGESAEVFHQDKSSRDSHAIREWLRKWKSRGSFPPGSHFGMTIKMGENEEPQLIQGPQWTDIKDNELLPDFVEIFEKHMVSLPLKTF